MTYKNFSFSAILKSLICRFTVFFKIFIVTALLATLALGAFYLNVQHEQTILHSNKIKSETAKISDFGDGIVLDTTAAIIKRDGNLPFAVAKKYAVWIYEAGMRYNVDPILILSVMAIESNFNYRAMSPDGPIGLLQITWSWHKEKSTKAALFDPKNNINVGTMIIKEYADKSSTDLETLLRFNGSLGQSPSYAIKVLDKKSKYNKEIMDAIVRSI